MEASVAGLTITESLKSILSIIGCHLTTLKLKWSLVMSCAGTIHTPMGHVPQACN